MMITAISDIHSNHLALDVYLTDALDNLIKNRQKVKFSETKGNRMDIDFLEDLERVGA
ncbi:MAG: hypothetical protein KKE96_07495 [Candidatus Altiarchaeota archaeon]|nr:hypothetical protein [Candidatus Altiarchaeota archaeon]